MEHNEAFTRQDEETALALAGILGDFAANPSPAFAARHRQAPWAGGAPAAPARRMSGWRRAALVPGLALVLFALWFALPAGARTGIVAAVGELLGFYRAPADVVDSPGPVGRPPMPPSVGSLEEASAIVGFDIRALPTWPRGVERIKITLMGEAVAIDYLDAQGYSQLTLMASRAPSFEQIGATAAVESVMVGAAPGEYVKGAWIGNGETARWDPTFEIASLSWKLDEGHYRLRSSAFTKEQLIELGVSLR